MAERARYQEIEQWLRARVLEGREGDVLPSEAEVAAQFGVSRMTARQAVQNLAAEGLVRRRRGAGTFIAPRPLHRHAGPLMSYTDDMRRRGLVPASRLVTAELRPSTPAEADALRLAPGTRIVAIERIRLADGTPMALDTSCLTPDSAGVLGHDLEAGSLHQALRSLGREPVSAQAWISARTATPHEARLLELSSKAAPVLVERRIIADAHGEPLELTVSVFNAAQYVIDAAFTLATTTGAGAGSGA